MAVGGTTALFDYPLHWAERFGVAPFLPTTRAEMEALGWDQCDVIIVTGDAYVDHPSFGMAVIGRVLEAQHTHKAPRAAVRRLGARAASGAQRCTRLLSACAPSTAAVGPWQRRPPTIQSVPAL